MKNNIKFGLYGAVAALAIATTANAIPNQDAIRYSTDGGITWSAATMDTAGTGDISMQIVAGAFSLKAFANGVNSSTYPELGTPAQPQMDLAVQGSATGTGTIMIQFTSINFTPIPTGSYITTEGANDGPAVTESSVTTIGTSDALFSPGVSGPSIGGASTGTFVSHIGSPVAGQSNPYAITLTVTFTATRSSGTSISSDTHLMVPDGGSTLMLLGSALSVLGFGVFRKSRKA